MNNYFQQCEKILESDCKRLLLHSCCAPCSSSVLYYLMPKTQVTVFFYNPNIMPEEEYLLRLAEQKRLCEILSVPLVVGNYDLERYLQKIKGLENECEGGKRCRVCFELRLRQTALYAKKEGFDYFGTTLTVSPHKNAHIINEVGQMIASQTGVKFLPSDFKKKDGYLRSIKLSKEYGLYRQEYCGCRLADRI